MTTEIILQNLGSFLPDRANYSKDANAFLTNGYCSAAGNVYFNVIRIGEGFAIKEDVGQGQPYTFLNALRIYSLKDKTLLMDRTYHCNFYSEANVKSEAYEMLLILVKEAAINADHRIDLSEARSIINQKVDEMFSRDQRQMLEEQNKKLLGN